SSWTCSGVRPGYAPGHIVSVRKTAYVLTTPRRVEWRNGSNRRHSKQRSRKPPLVGDGLVVRRGGRGDLRPPDGIVVGPSGRFRSIRSRFLIHRGTDGPRRHRGFSSRSRGGASAPLGAL